VFVQSPGAQGGGEGGGNGEGGGDGGGDGGGEGGTMHTTSTPAAATHTDPSKASQPVTSVGQSSLEEAASQAKSDV